MYEKTPDSQSEETLEVRIKKQCENNNTELEKLLIEKGKQETKKLAQTIEEGQEFNKKIYHRITDMEIQRLELKIELEEYAKKEDSHMTKKIQMYTKCIPTIQREKLNQLLSLDLEIK